jgi:hypothetical protein
MIQHQQQQYQKMKAKASSTTTTSQNKGWRIIHNNNITTRRLEHHQHQH